MRKLFILTFVLFTSCQKCVKCDEEVICKENFDTQREFNDEIKEKESKGKFCSYEFN